MIKHTHMVALVGLLVLAACGGRNAIPVNSPIGSDSSRITTTESLVTHGYFTEYSIPAGVHPSDLVRGPYDTVYFTNPGSSGGVPNLYEMVASTGQIHTFTAPAPYQSAGFDGVVSLNRSVYYVVKQPVNEDTFYFARVTPEGVFSFTGAPYFEFGLLTNLAVMPNGTSFTYGYCIDPCQAPTNGVAAGANLDDGLVPTSITAGPGGYLYATARCQSICSPVDSRVYVISTSATIVHKFNLPNGANPQGIITGSDHNLWITEPGRNKIARMIPSTGAVTEYSLPTANANPDRITYGYDNAQFFTETSANKIGRITTTGVITEYTIPTAASQPTGITPCASTVCGSHGGLWFTETAANKIGRFNAPN